MAAEMGSELHHKASRKGATLAPVQFEWSLVLRLLNT